MPASPRDLTFISYSHIDHLWLDKLQVTLKPLVRKGSVTLWADTQIRPGDQWRDEIQRALSSAKVAVLLVSRNFLASDFIAKHELPPLLKKAKAGGLTVLWVHLSASLYEETEIESYQAAHDIAKPLDSLSESEQAKVLVEIARRIRDAVAQKEEGPLPDGSQEAIKGLRPFRYEDADIFARLGRQREVEDCARTIGDPEFRFGILTGESGCGKSSFLQAGLWPRLETYRVRHRCVYVKFSNEDPFETLKRAVSKSLQIPIEDLRQLDLLAVLQTAVQAETKPLVLLFDQFEQFFVHRKLKQDREPFVRALADWYRNGADLPVKILVCIRGDFSDRLVELQNALGYTIVLGQHVRLEKFEPQEAAKVIKQIAEVEGLPVEERLLESMVKELAGREDGRISPAYLQIVAWVLSRQKEADKRAFTSKAFQKLGGIEGLLDRFLADVLDARPSEASKQTVLKILVVLIDLDRNARAGQMTVETLQEKLKDTLNPMAVPEAVKWLASPDVRLITQQEQQDPIAYELAHECLIPAVRKLAGRQLLEADRANQILDRRVNEWLGNDQHPSYLLGWRDWRLVERNRPYLIWGGQRNQKDQLLEKTKQRWQRRKWAGAGVLLLLVGAVAGWFSPWGQIQKVKWDLTKLSRGSDQTVLKAIANVLPSLGELDWAAEVASRISDSVAKAQALAAVAQAAAQSGEKDKAIVLVKHAEEVADRIKESVAKAQALAAVAQAAAQSGEKDKAIVLVKHAEEVAGKFRLPGLEAEVLVAVAQAAAQLGEVHKAVDLLKKAAEMTAAAMTGPEDEPYNSELLKTVGEAVAKVANATNNITLLDSVAEVVCQTGKPPYNAAGLAAVSEGAARIASTTKNSAVLNWAVKIARMLDQSRWKAEALGVVAEATAQMGDASRATAILKEAMEVTGPIEGPYNRSLKVVAQAAAQVASATKNTTLLNEAVAMARKITDTKKTEALGAIVQSAAQMGDMSKATALLEVMEAMVDRTEDSFKNDEPLMTVALATAQMASATKDIAPLKQALAAAEEITDPDSRAEALAAIACHAARLGYWRQARAYVDFNSTDQGRTQTLTQILRVRYGVDKNCSATE
jgi:tetratricopeptide (TPR) repeat protein